ncbi:MAG TPA: hypothetical protein DEP48_03025 [Persephonella sp.]|uniref:Uncharacterized protein n=1 Tax=Persephonella marina (strain DSM 14350 / EX-H1) TaxID=123214 RepID=C0QSB9_PERMH|nr:MULTISPECIES: hypothetical protein [Persephonella]ACO03428.1 hypothetical protein PERMA_1802 [Persephonella marina EX-H1]HCB69311.1 hypothetical protein [Persephonella sp.]
MEILQGLLSLFFIISIGYIAFTFIKKKPKKVPVSISIGLFIALFIVDALTPEKKEEPKVTIEKTKKIKNKKFEEVLQILQQHPYMVSAEKVNIKSSEDNFKVIEIHFFEKATFMDYALGFKNLTQEISKLSNQLNWFYIDVYNGDKFIFRLQYFPHQVLGVYQKDPNGRVIHAIIMNNLQVVKKNKDLETWFIEQCRTYKGYLDPFCRKVI